MYGNVVALAHTKETSLTNCAFALSTDDSEHGGLYNALFDVIKDGENESELIEIMLPGRFWEMIANSRHARFI